jgi:hypothetical protein
MGRRVMTGFIRVSPEGYRTDTALKKWIARGVAFVATMPKAASAKRATATKNKLRRAPKRSCKK